MFRIVTAVLVALALVVGCAAPSPEERQEASTGRITKIVPVVIESDSAPGLGTAFTKKTANRPGSRISVLTNDNKLMEVTQDEDRSLKVGDVVRIEGFGTKAKILRP